MKLSAQEEYGLRCLLRIASSNAGSALTIPEISAAEGLSVPYVGKLMRILRQGGFVRSTRGQVGGYTLARPARLIPVGEVLGLLGGRLVEADFCNQFSGQSDVCARSIDCAMRSLWQSVQNAVDGVLTRITLDDLTRDERDMTAWLATGTKAPGRVQAARTPPP
jgi:Rrf2 family protein